MIQNELQRYVFKIGSSKLRWAKWNLTLPLSEARENDELISLAGSQILRWIDELNGDTDCEVRAKEIRKKIKYIKSQPNSAENKRLIRQLYSELDKVQFKPDYVTIVMDRASDYRRLCKGFSVNGIKYKRLLGTPGGIKTSTIVFISERLKDEIEKRINNGRNENKPINPAKLEAYRALTCSASFPVSIPEGILVVPDCENEFDAHYIYLANGEGDSEPIMEDRHESVKVDVTDGFGLMLPSLAERWSKELGLDYLVSGINSRFPFTKGMVFTFDFVDFAEKISGTYIVKDAWGYEHDIRDIELVLTTSMLKLWDSYGSIDEYLKKTRENHYSFGVTKVAPKELDKERNLNYQFIQSHRMSEDQILDLISPTINEFEDVISGDWVKSILFLKGMGLSENNVHNLPNDYIKAMMIDPKIADDPFVVSSIYNQIKKRITEAKTGVVKVHGNFSIASGDPYTLCQSIFGMKITGLLKSGEIYSKYWSDYGSDKLVAYRAPMSCHNSVVSLTPVATEEMKYWYRYITTCTIMNSWDMSCAALNGMDFDGDLIMLTDNKSLVDTCRNLPALQCQQKSAQKIIPTEEDYIASNIASFGNDIGKVTNKITSMYEVQSYYPEDSKEFKELDYRICCGQLHQQDVIDKIKGIIAKPMARSWYDWHAVNEMEDDAKKDFYISILAEKKPYFMRYIYPDLAKKINSHNKTSNINCIRKFAITLEDLLNKPDNSLSDQEKEFIKYYHYKSPAGDGDCVMNKICHIFENKFDGFVGEHNANKSFDYKIMKSGTEATKHQVSQITSLYKGYNKKIQNIKISSDHSRIDKIDTSELIDEIQNLFLIECEKICPDRKALCDIVLDIAYSKSSTKRFAWDMCGDTIIENLIEKNKTISFPTRDANGSISYGGETFSIKTINMEAYEDVE